MNYDIIIQNGRILDGAGNPWHRADLGIIGDSIEAIGDLAMESAEEKINAKDMMISPGFIDIHSHSDFTILVDRRAESKIRQGVTTEVVGNCGTSAAPMNKAVKSYREKYMRAQLGESFDFSWKTTDDYMRLIDSKGVSFNVVTLVGQGTVRQNVMGYENRPATDDELEEMKRHIAESMEEGAWGMSTGLIYPPSCYAGTDEILELAKVLVRYGGVYFSHIRNEGGKLLEAVKEAIEIGERSSVPVQIAHFKASGKKYWGKTEESLRLVDEARKRGVDVTFDQYPYTASSTSLSALLPQWAHEGGSAKLLERLRDPEIRRKIVEGPEVITRDLDTIVVSYAKNNPQLEGKSITEIAETEGKPPMEVVFDLLLAEDAQVNIISHGMSEDDVRRVMRSPYMMVGSDGRAVSPKGILGRGKPHPRFYGTFPRVLGHYVREGVITLEDAVRKMTSAPAQRLGLWDRGLLKEGFKADIVLFEPDVVNDEATFIKPHAYATGITHVIVNGKLVVDRSKHTGALPGRALRKNK